MFIVLAGALALLTAFALALPFIRRRDEAMSRAAYDAQTYRAQLSEIDQDVMRGVLTEAEAKAAKIEISRRLLAATDALEAEGAAPDSPSSLKKGIGFGAAIGIPALATLLYLEIGGAGRPDVPLASRTDFEAQMAQRPSQINAEEILERAGAAPEPAPLDSPEAKRIADMIAQVEKVLESRPDDAEGRRILARTQSQVGRFGEAWRNYAILVDQAAQPDLQIYGELIETMVSATNGYVSPEAESVIDRGLSLAPGNPRFAHYKALTYAQNNEGERALMIWTGLLNNAEPGAPWAPMIYGHASRMASALDLPPPPEPHAAPGPSQEDMAAAADMSATDRTAMIDGMVSGLADRLAQDPNDLGGWLRLIRAYTVLGRVEDRDAALETARATFAEDAGALERLQDAAQ